MENFKTVLPEEIPQNLFHAIGKDWMLVTARNGDTANPMTASWGGTGILWGKPVAFVFLRPQRFTRELVDAADSFSLSFYDESYRKQLALCGANSGRDVDKTARCGFTPVLDRNAPYFAEAHTVLLCKKLYRQPLDPACFLDDTILSTYYPEKDYHILYVAEIETVLIKA